MKWISNGDPPLYVWEGDRWYNQKDKMTYSACVESRIWANFLDVYAPRIPFPKKTKVMK